MKKMLTFITSIVLILQLASCNNVNYNDPLSTVTADMPITEELPKNDWVPLISDDEAINAFGFGSRQDTAHPAFNARKCYGEFVYYCGEYIYEGTENAKPVKMLLRYNMETGKSEPACRDSACTHDKDDCPFYKPDEIKRFFIDDGVLYYLRVKLKPSGKIDTSKAGGIHSYNLKTMEYKYLCKWEGCESTFLDLYGDFIYYFQYDFHTDDNGYDVWAWSCNINNGETEKLFCWGDETDTMFQGRKPMTIDEKGRLIFQNIKNGYMPPEEKEVDIVFEAAELKKDAEPQVLGKEQKINMSFNTFVGFVYANSKIYYPEKAGKKMYSITENGQSVQIPVYYYTVRSIDLESGETETVIENTAGNFAIGGKYLYCTPFKPKKVNLECGQTVITTYGEVIQINLENGEERRFKISENIELGLIGQNFFYYRGRLFANIVDTDIGTHIYGEFDIPTGKYRELVTEIVNAS